MKSVKAWAIVQGDGLCREGYTSQYDVYLYRSAAADTLNVTTVIGSQKARIVRVEIREVKPKKRKAGTK